MQIGDDTFEVAVHVGDGVTGSCGGEETLVLRRTVTVSDRKQCHSERVATLRHELAKRKEDLVCVRRDVDALMQRAKKVSTADGKAALGDLACMLGVQDRHETRIAELRAMRDVRVAYSECRSVEQATLQRSGVFQHVSWFDAAVAWVSLASVSTDACVIERHATRESSTEMMSMSCRGDDLKYVSSLASGVRGSGDGDLNCPDSVAISTDNGHVLRL